MALFKWFKSERLRKRVIRELQLTAISLLFICGFGIFVMVLTLLLSNLYFFIIGISLFLVCCLNRFVEDSISKKDLLKINNDTERPKKWNKIYKGGYQPLPSNKNANHIEPPENP